MAANPKRSQDDFDKKWAEDFDRKWARIIKKTTTDEVLKQRLLHHPKEVLNAHGMEVPPEITIKVVENTKTMRYLVLPEPQVAKNLSEEELRNIAGGRVTPTW